MMVKQGEGDITTRTRTVLIVDDDEALLSVLKISLERKKYVVFTATSGNLALQVLKREEVDLVLSDCRMPDGDGLFLLSEVRKQNKITPIFVLMTGYTEISIEDAKKKGANYMFFKPIRSQELHQIIDQYFAPQVK